MNETEMNQCSLFLRLSVSRATCWSERREVTDPLSHYKRVHLCLRWSNDVILSSQVTWPMVSKRPMSSTVAGIYVPDVQYIHIGGHVNDLLVCSYEVVCRLGSYDVTIHISQLCSIPWSNRFNWTSRRCCPFVKSTYRVPQFPIVHSI